MNFFHFLIILIFLKQFLVHADSSQANGEVFAYKSAESCSRTEFYDFDLFTCVPCGKDEVVSKDGLSCECSPNRLQYAVKAGPVCSSPSFKFVNFTSEKSIQIWRQNTSNCNLTENALYQDNCIAKELLKPYATYDSFKLQDGHFANLKIAAFACKSLHNATECNHLANLCVHSFFNTDKNSPCALFYYSQSMDVPFLGGLVAIRPFLFFKKGKAATRQIDEAIDYSFEKNEKIKLFTHYLTTRGTLQKRDFRLENLNLCGNHVGRHDVVFADNIEWKCQLTTQMLIDRARREFKTDFLSIFLNYSLGGVPLARPVPVLIRNVFENKDEDPTNWQLVKRFQLLTALANNKSFKSLSFVDNIDIICTIKAANTLTIPLITLNYKTIDLLAANANRSSEDAIHDFRLRIVFKRDKQSINFIFQIFLPVLLTVAFCMAVLRAVSYKHRGNFEFYNCGAFWHFCVHLLSYVGNVFIGVAVGALLFVLLVVTYQNEVDILLPIEEEGLIEVLLFVGVVLKVIYLSWRLWKMACSDIFFVDWERPKIFDNFINFKSNLDTPSVCSSARTLSSEGSVSVWRMFFVANQWLQLCSKRKTSVFVQSLALVWIGHIYHPLNQATIILIYFLTYASQLVAAKVLHQLNGDPIQKLVDICSIANISIFAMVQKSYGFYIHGRSPHGFSDTDMPTISLQLQREAQNMCGKRGLLTDSDQQTYITFVPTDFRNYYKKLLSPALKSALHSQLHLDVDSNNSSYYYSSNRFFCAFIDHAIKDLDYIIKERSFCEGFLDFEFDQYLTGTNGTFYVDKSNSFQTLFLWGHEFELTVVELSILLILNSFLGSLPASLIVLCLLSKLTQTIYKEICRKTIAEKALIDKRFLP